MDRSKSIAGIVGPALIGGTKIIKLDSQNLEILWTEGYVEKYTRDVL